MKRSVALHLTSGVMESRFDWLEQMAKTVACIKSWERVR